jgi:hypothetical protein
MPRTAYPIASDLINFLAAQYLVDNPPAGAAALFDYGLAVTAAIQDFEQETQRTFLAGAPATRYYAPPGNRLRLLDFRADLLTLTSVVYQPLNGSAQTLVLDTDFRLGPANAGVDGYPSQYLELYYRWWVADLWSLQRAMQITGIWAFSSQVPEDVWQAILWKATISMLPELATMNAGHLVSWKQGVVQEVYGTNPLGKIQERYQAQYDRVLKRYRRKSIW